MKQLKQNHFDHLTKIYSEKDKMKFIDKILLGIGLMGLFLYSVEQLWLLIYEWEILW